MPLKRPTEAEREVALRTLAKCVVMDAIAVAGYEASEPEIVEAVRDAMEDVNFDVEVGVKAVEIARGDEWRS